MDGKELKHLSRSELVDIIYQMKKNEDALQEQVNFLQSELEEKRIKLEESGTLADAAAKVTDIFAAAQETADLYLQEIATRKAETEAECEKMIADAKQQVEAILTEGGMKFARLNAQYQAEYKKLTQLQTLTRGTVK